MVILVVDAVNLDNDDNNDDNNDDDDDDDGDNCSDNYYQDADDDTLSLSFYMGPFFSSTYYKK